MEKIYTDFAWEKAASLPVVDSPGGYTARAAAWVRNVFTALGFAARITTKGGVYASHGYERSHIDGVYNTLKLLKEYVK